MERALRPEIVPSLRLQIHLVAFLTLVFLSAAACGRTVAPADDVVVESKVMPSAPIVDGEVMAEITLLDRDRQPLRGASLRLEAHMNHPGMPPIIGAASEQGNGVYTVRVRFSMAGTWILFVKGELPDRRPIDRRVGETTVGGLPPA